MYNLGDHFKVDFSKIMPKENQIFKGNTYRITVLSNTLVRIEYGNILDKSTQLVKNRCFNEELNLEVKQDEKYLEIKTPNFYLTYTKEQPFKNNLKIECNGKHWYIAHPEARTLQTPSTSINAPYIKSLYSLDGIISINDNTLIEEENGSFTKREGEYIDTYDFLYANDFNTCLKDYFKLTGYPPLIPRYALGIWWSKSKNYKTDEIKQLVTDFKDNQIPLSALLLDHNWHLNVYDKKFVESGFTWNGSLINNPTELISFLHSKGIRLGLVVNPNIGFYPFESTYDTIKKYLGNNDGIIPFNALDAKALDVYLKLLIHPLDNIGVDFYCNDTDEINTNYWLTKNANYIDMTRNYQKRPIILAKKTNLADHRYGIIYTGKTKVNFKTLSDVAKYNVDAPNAGLSFYAHDIGGFYEGSESSNLYTRFIQLGTFSPIFKFGSSESKYYKREPWRWETEVFEIAKYYLNLRQKMILYLYNEAYNYHKFGKLLIEPIYYKYPHFYDNEIYRNEYYLGQSLLVSPIIQKEDEVMKRTVHKFYIPEGIWYDFSTGKKYPGDRKYTTFYKLKDYPVFAKAGAIIPFGYNENMNDTTAPNILEIQIFPGKSNKYELYEDDGVSSLYKQGFYVKTLIDYNYYPSNYTVIIRPTEGKSNIIPQKRTYKIVFRNVRQADEVIAYEQDMKIVPKTKVEGPNFIVELENVNTLSQLTVNCKGKDIEIDAVKIIDEDIEAIINDLEINTSLKEEIDKILFGKEPIAKKRIAIRKLRSKGLDLKFVRLFLRLLEHLNQL